jgi:hypothetical protein
MAKSETHDQMIEAICDYRKGWTNIHSATKELGELAGLTPEVAKALLDSLKSNSVTKIRGYSKESEATFKGKIGKFNEAKK